LFLKSFVCFGCFDTGLKRRNKPKKIVFGFAKQPKNNQNRLSFGSNPKKIDCFEDTLLAAHVQYVMASRTRAQIIFFSKVADVHSNCSVPPSVVTKVSINRVTSVKDKLCKPVPKDSKINE
jgi:hypothetical protein